MHIRWHRAVVVTAVCVVAANLWLDVRSRAAVDESIREERVVTVRGVKETWRLVWDGQPRPVCGPDDDLGIAGAITCPCAGFAYGESGRLLLVRVRAGREVERMSLGPLFMIEELDGPSVGTPGSAVLAHWPEKPDDFDREERGDSRLAADIKHRPAVGIMKVADYDRDGAATEFLLQVATLPCGKRQFVAVGVTAVSPRLHALSSVTHPERPLVMPAQAWKALQEHSGPATVPTWECGDHGSERRTELVVSARAGAIQVRNRAFTCPENGERERLAEDTAW